MGRDRRSWDYADDLFLSSSSSIPQIKASLGEPGGPYSSGSGFSRPLRLIEEDWVENQHVLQGPEASKPCPPHVLVLE